MDNGYEGTRATDRRVQLRRASGARVWADPGGVAPVIDCRIVDISDAGAQIAPLRGALPDEFLLQHETQRTLGDAKVVWRRGDAVGVKIGGR